MQYREELKKFLNGRKLKFLGMGRNRKVYLLPGDRYVLKVPRNMWGEGDNDWEHCHRYCKDAWSQTMKVNARCRLISGTWLLVMEYVKPLTNDEVKELLNCDEVPNWINCIDCGQVGLTRKGELKAYDYGRH